MIIVRRQRRGFKTPQFIGVNGNSAGGALNVADSLAGDWLLCISTNGSVTIPGAAPGTTAIGSGDFSDESANDRALMCSWRIAASDAQNIDPDGSARAILAAFRDVDPITLLFAYAHTSGTSLVMPSLSPFPRPMMVLGVGALSGAADALIPGMTDLRTQSAGSAQLQLAWFGAGPSLGALPTLQASYGGDSGGTISASGARVTCAIAIGGSLQ